MFNKNQVFEIIIPDIDDEQLNAKIINRYIGTNNAIDVLNKLKKSSKDGAIVLTPDDNKYTEWKKNVIVVLDEDWVGIVPMSLSDFWDFVEEQSFLDKVGNSQPYFYA